MDVEQQLEFELSQVEEGREIINDYRNYVLEEVSKELQKKYELCPCGADDTFCDCTGLLHAREVVESMKRDEPEESEEEA